MTRGFRSKWIKLRAWYKRCGSLALSSFTEEVIAKKCRSERRFYADSWRPSELGCARLENVCGLKAKILLGQSRR